MLPSTPTPFEVSIYKSNISFSTEGGVGGTRQCPQNNGEGADPEEEKKRLLFQPRAGCKNEIFLIEFCLQKIFFFSARLAAILCRFFASFLSAASHLFRAGEVGVLFCSYLHYCFGDGGKCVG
ncbi:hypothetical protein AVEN_185680-1 [Araneus ventricosus]|uniref:Uncharacterized protein n=1 Tax=Araneus ventricosus TaxID=182803 RepID=A0A4Y2U4D2_ARAVE|nr:hypothetical protein AVEN_185680-1 [Araneus ventricosus]